MAYPQQAKDQENLPTQSQQYTPSAPEYAPVCLLPTQPVYLVVGVRYPPPAPGYGYPPPTGYYPPPTLGYPPVGATYGPPIINQPSTQDLPTQCQQFTSPSSEYAEAPVGSTGHYPPPTPGYPPVGGKHGSPIINQPSTQGWIVMPQGLSACPPGLEYLSMIDQLLVHQKVEVLEAISDFETKNKYIIKNNLGQKVYYACEDTTSLTRECYEAYRPFHLKILDNYGNEVIHMYRPMACTGCSCFCPESMEVSAPPGNIIGKIEQDPTLCTNQFSIKNANDEIIFRIEGPTWSMIISGNIEYQVLSTESKIKVGVISKQCRGLAFERFTDADFFGITFPIDLDVRMKAVMMGACFLIDMMYFES